MMSYCLGSSCTKHKNNKSIMQEENVINEVQNCWIINGDNE